MSSVPALTATTRLPTAINVIMAVAAGRPGPTRASATTFLLPVVALLPGVVVRGEQVPAVAIGGGALCLTGAWLMRRRTMRNNAGPNVRVTGAK